MASPDFLSDGHTPNRFDSKWEVLQKILGALNDISGGGGGGGPFVQISGDTMTGDLSVPDVTITANGELSDPAFSVTGTPITGGTATTTKPLVLIEPAGATSTGWNTAGTLFGINAAPGAIVLCDFQSNGSSRFSVTGGGAVTIASAGTIGWSDTILVRAAADTLALRRGANLQNLRIYGTYTDDSSGEWLAIESGGTVFNITTYANGSGTANSLRLGTGGISRWTIDTSGHFLSASDNTYDIGASGANRPRNGYFAGNLVANLLAIGTATPSSSTPIYALGTTNSTYANLVRNLDTGSSASAGFNLQTDAGTVSLYGYSAAHSVWANSVSLAVSTYTAGMYFYMSHSAPWIWYTSGAERLRITGGGLVTFGGTTSSFPALKRSSTELQVRLADDSADAPIKASKITTSSATFMHETSAALNDGAAASTGTLTNAPAAGNPTKWIPINDNGTTRYIPAW